MNDPGPYRAIPCPCGAAVCKNWLVDPVAAIQGVAFSQVQAEFVAETLNLAAINGEKILSTELLRRPRLPRRPIQAARPVATSRQLGAQ